MRELLFVYGMLRPPLENFLCAARPAPPSLNNLTDLTKTKGFYIPFSSVIMD